MVQSRGQHAGLQHHARTVKRQSDTNSGACSLYGHPSAGETVNAYEDFDITWDCACLNGGVKDIDITLYYYGGGALHAWTGVSCADNSLTTQFKPSWWNSTTSANLQLQITESNQPVWATTTGLGPSFEINWNGTTPASMNPGNGTSTGVSIESINSNQNTGGVTGGKLAAAVTVPLLAGAIAVAAYIFYSRRKGKDDRKRWSAYVDDRMSHYSQATGAHSPGRTTGPRPSMHSSRVQSQYSFNATAGGNNGSPEKNRLSGMVMMQQHSSSGGRPSLASRPVSNYSLGSNTGNFAGVGSSNLRMPPMAAQLPNDIMKEEIGGTDSVHSRGASTAAGSMTGLIGGNEKRPASSFYALDGHSFVETPSSAGFETQQASHHQRGQGVNGSISSINRPSSQFGRAHGTGVGERVSRVSFADSSFTGREAGGGERRSYFSNGPGTASSPNAHRYKNSQGNSISGNSIFNGNNKPSETPAMPKIPLPTAFGRNRDVTKGVEANEARSLSTEDLAGILVDSKQRQIGSPSSFKTAALPGSDSATGSLASLANEEAILASGSVHNDNNASANNFSGGGGKKKHNITISTSMPRLANPENRQSILSPDDMLKAYAAKSAIAGPSPRTKLPSNLSSSTSIPTLGQQHQQQNIRPDTVLSDASRYPDEQEYPDHHQPGPTSMNMNGDGEEVLAPQPVETSSKKGIFNTKFKFGSSK